MELTAHKIMRNPHVFPAFASKDFTDFQPFVISNEMLEPMLKKYKKDSRTDVLLAAPFTKFSIEVERAGDDPNEVWPIVVSPESDTDPEVGTFWIGCEELFPDKYKMYILYSFADDRMPRGEVLTEDSAHPAYWHLKKVMDKIFTIMRTSDISISGERPVMKYKVNGVKKQCRPNKIIYISKRRKEKLVTALHSPMKIHHLLAWSVMGHWRRISPTTMGKDRLGHQNVPGFTWIKDYVKGDKAMGGRVAIRKVP